MWSRRLALLALLLVAPTALAHDDPGEVAYDPLTLDFLGWPAPGGTISPSPPADGAVFFSPAAPPASDPPTLAFSFAAPARFAPANGFDVRLRLAAEKAAVLSTQTSAALHVALLANARLVEQKDAALPAVVKPGDAIDAAVVIPTPGALFDKGTNLTLRLSIESPLLPEGALKVLVGPGGSRASFLGAALPTLADLELDEPADTAIFLLAKSTFSPPEAGAALSTLSVTHNATTTLSPLVSGAVSYVVLRGDDTVAEGRAFHEFPDAARRNAAAHVYRVGASRVRVHPGVGVAVRVVGVVGQGVEIACEQSCPPGGYKASLPAFNGTDLAQSRRDDAANLLIPPPRSTAGIPVSGDAPPEEKKSPGPEAWAAVAALGAIAFARRSRR